MNNLKVAAALRLLADALETPAEAAEAADLPPLPGIPLANHATEAAAKPRGRGRPPKDTSPAAPATPPAAVEADPFGPTAPPAPEASLDDVRAALTALKAATTQDNALAVLKTAGGVSNLSDLQRNPEKYGVVVQAAKKALDAIVTDAEPDDPFETGGGAPAEPPAKAATIEDVKAACVAAGKRTSQDTVTKVVMKHGGRAPDGKGGEGPSLKALPLEAYAAVIKEVGELPTTK